ncbi:MAG TPA: DUF2499 domain-containing protein, partial [Cyanophyceae cyanobacterium]
PESLEWLVTLQASTTVLGNTTLCAAAWWIWRSAQNTNKTTTAIKPKSTVDVS